MATISDALPIQFWPVGTQTFNQQVNAFVDVQYFYQEFLSSDTIKLQVNNETTVTNLYFLKVLDTKNNVVEAVPFTQTSLGGGVYVWDLEFVPSSLSVPLQDNFYQLVIGINYEFSFDSTFDSTFSGGGSDLWISDFVKFSSSIMTNAGWGTQLIQYKSTKNFVGINYPNTGNYFNLRIPARFFLQRTVSQQNSLPLSNSQVINTSLTKKYEQLLETVYMPDYLLNKIEIAFAHAVRGSVMINGVEWTIDESFDRSSPDPKFSMQMGKVWLTRKNYYVRNVI